MRELLQCTFVESSRPDLRMKTFGAIPPSPRSGKTQGKRSGGGRAVQPGPPPAGAVRPLGPRGGRPRGPARPLTEGPSGPGGPPPEGRPPRTSGVCLEWGRGVRGSSGIGAGPQGFASRRATPRRSTASRVWAPEGLPCGLGGGRRAPAGVGRRLDGGNARDSTCRGGGGGGGGVA